MAINALPRWHRVRADQGKAGSCVIEHGVGPEHSIVTGLARRGKSCRGVIHRTERVVVIGLVARNASGIGDGVVVVDMAVGALARRHGMRSGEREAGAVVIERSIQPSRSAVAGIAGLGKIRGNVIRVRCALIILQVACYADAAGQTVIVVNVAIRTLAGGHGVKSGKGEPGGGVIEGGIGPGDRVMATLASGWESRMRHRAGGIVVIGLVATDARGAGDVVIVVGMAVGALARRNGVRSGQWESGFGMIEGCRLPRGRIVAELAGLNESASHVVRIGRTLEILQMA